MCNDWNFNIEQWRAHGFSKQRLIARVVWVCDKGDTSRNQLWASGGNGDVARTIGAGEVNGVIRTGSLAVFKFGLCNCSAEVDVPQCWCFLRISLTT